MQVIFNRVSVCAGDDGTSHEERFVVAGSTSLGELLEHDAVPYLIHWPGATWVLPRVGTYAPGDGPVARIGEPWPCTRFTRAADRDLTLEQPAVADDAEEAGRATKPLALCFGYAEGRPLPGHPAAGLMAGGPRTSPGGPESGHSPGMGPV